MDFLTLAKERYSVRKFSDRPVEKEKLERILEAGNCAPTAKNLQPQKIYVLQSEEALKIMNEISPCVFGAKTVLVFAYDTGAEWQNPLEEGIRSGVEDVSIVATHMMMEAADLGLGTCWCNYFANSRLEKALNLPENEKAVLFMPLGYAAEDSVPSANHTAKKDINEIVKYI